MFGEGWGMIAKTVTAYYCEFCKKRYLNKAFIIKHEKGCTLNPERHCKLCEMHNEDNKIVLKKLIEQFKENKITEEQFGYIKKKLNNCPMCILAFLRQSKCYNISGLGGVSYFNFKKELSEFWDEHNRQIKYLDEQTYLSWRMGNDN